MPKNEIINTLKSCSSKYIDGIIKYLEFAMKSNIIINNKNHKLLHLGHRAITHIFQTNLIQTGDIEVSYFSMQKGYLYYLEYLEQVEQSNMNDDLNHTNAIMFVYDKSLINYSKDNRKTIKLDNSILSTMPRIVQLVDTILWWENKDIAKQDIQYNIVNALCDTLYQANDNILNAYIECGQKRKMNILEYNDFLNCTLKLFRDKSKHIPSIREWEDIILTKNAYIDEALKELSISKWCKFLWE